MHLETRGIKEVAREYKLTRDKNTFMRHKRIHILSTKKLRISLLST